MIKLNGQQINSTLFPDGTSQVWNISLDTLSKSVSSNIFNIEWEFSHEAELFHLMQLVELLKTFQPEYQRHLNMDFLPYGRQDKIVSNSTTFALTTFAKILNTMEFDKVTSLDTHNPEVTSWLINNFKNIFPYTQIQAAVDNCDPDVLCFPDKGAITRYGKELAFLGKIHVYGEKERDQLSGHITKYVLHGDVLDRDVLMVDDLCDGGMTFILMAKALLTNGAKSVNLYTTHGVYSKGLRPLKEANIQRIFNKDGEVSKVQDRIVIKEI